MQDPFLQQQYPAIKVPTQHLWLSQKKNGAYKVLGISHTNQTSSQRRFLENFKFPSFPQGFLECGGMLDSKLHPILKATILLSNLGSPCQLLKRCRSQLASTTQLAWKWRATYLKEQVTSTGCDWEFFKAIVKKLQSPKQTSWSPNAPEWLSKVTS